MMYPQQVSATGVTATQFDINSIMNMLIMVMVVVMMMKMMGKATEGM
jgi:hypothetical protein